MNKKIVIIIAIILILGLLTVLGINLVNVKKFYDPEYNTSYITEINQINIQNDKIKHTYQFVYLADLHASIIDENEPDEQIKNTLVDRNNLFFGLNPTGATTTQIFNEVINYANNKNADALLMGGDIIDTPANSNINFMKENLNRLKCKYLYTFGNHDWSFSWDFHTENAEKIQRPKFNEFMEDSKVSYLEYEDLIILAIDDSDDRIYEESIEKIKNILDKKKPTIVMIHVPIATKFVAEEAMKARQRVAAIGEYGIKPDESTQKAMDLILSDKYDVVEVISGHIHYAIKDNLKPNLEEIVSGPAYAGNINLIKINN